MRPAGWTPCALDPECFDCGDCDASPKHCDYLVDASLRQEHAAVWRRRTGTAGASHELIGLVERVVQELYRHQGISASVDLISHHAKTMGVDLLPIDAESGARASSRIESSSPGMYRPSESLSVRSQSPLPPTVGERMEAMLALTAIPLGKPEQLALFKRLAAYRTLLQFDSWEVASRELTEYVDATLPRAMETTNWSTHDIYRYSSGSAKLPREEAGVEDLSSLLAAVQALEIGTGGPSSDWATEAAAIETLLTVRNLRLVAHTARRHAGRRFLWYADLFQEGCIGLMRAVKRFDPYRGNEFSTFAVWWIRQGITRASADKELPIRLPAYLAELARKIGSVDQSQVAHGLPRLSLGELSTSIGETDETRLSEVRSALMPIVRLADAEAEPSADILDELGERLESNAAVRRSLALLPERERAVVEMRYGVLDGIPRTLQAVGDELQLTRERVRQIEHRAFKKLRPLLAAAGVESGVAWIKGESSGQ